MRSIRTPGPTLSSLLFAAGTNIAIAAGVAASRPETGPQSPTFGYVSADERDARPRDLVALQDDLFFLDASLATLPRRHPRFEEFSRRVEHLRADVTLLAERMRRDDRDTDRRAEERYGADHRFIPARRTEIRELRNRIAALRDEVEDAASRRPGSGDFLLPSGTEIEVMLDSGLSSRWANPGDPIEASTVSALRRNGRTVLPAGAVLSGAVREVRSRRRGQSDGWLRLDFDALNFEGEPRIGLRCHVVSISEVRRDSGAARNGALGAILGGVIGGMIDGRKGALIGAAVGAGGGLLATHGEDVDLPEGTLIVVRLDRPVTLPRRGRARWN